MIYVLALAALTAAPATKTAAPAKPSILAPANRTVQMDPKAGVHKETVRGAPFQITALVLPETFTNVFCGNCTEEQGEQAANWYMHGSKEEATVYLKPTRLPDAAHPPASFNTTMHITLVSGYRITVTIGLADLNGPLPPDAEVAFTMPESAKLRGRLAEEGEKLEQDFKERLERESMNRFLDALIGQVHCESTNSKPHRDERLYVRVGQICTARGESETIWVTFEVKNRANGITHLGSAQLQENGGEGSIDTSRQAFRYESDSLRYNETTRGIALVTVPEGQPKPAAWELVLEEEGGKNRTVVAGDLEF